jgi:hypothetical protein
MRSIILLIIAVVFSFDSNAQVNCQKFKNGTFCYPSMPGKISVRKDSIQESYNDGRLEMLWKVNWLSECKYEMVCLKIFVDTYEIDVGDRIVAEIIETDESCFNTSLTVYPKGQTEGVIIPGGPMCIKKE